MITRCRVHDDCECNGKATTVEHTCTFCGTLHPLTYQLTIPGGTGRTLRAVCPNSRQHRPRGATP